MKKYIRLMFIATVYCNALYSFDEGFIWGLRANFNGTYSMPSISASDLDKLGASYMNGSLGYTMDGEAELGYLFGSKRWFGGMETDKFSGMSLFGSAGVGSGFAGMVAGNTIEGVTVNVFMNVNYAPVASFGIGTKAYFFNSKLALGLQIGAKMIADLSPEYLAYSDNAEILSSEIGEIIVTDFMIKNMNPFMASLKFFLEYNQPVNERMEVILGIYMRYNIFRPKYITMPDSLLNALNTQLTKEEKPNFTLETPLDSYYINSLDFGLSVGLQFKG